MDAKRTLAAETLRQLVVTQGDEDLAVRDGVEEVLGKLSGATTVTKALTSLHAIPDRTRWREIHSGGAVDHGIVVWHFCSQEGDSKVPAHVVTHSTTVHPTGTQFYYHRIAHPSQPSASPCTMFGRPASAGRCLHRRVSIDP